MKALLFHNSLWRQGLSFLGGRLTPWAYVSPLAPTRLETVETPGLRGPEWAVLDVRLCGICGSDTKQVFLEGMPDNPLTAILSFPHGLGHEMVGVVRTSGATSGVEPGARVALCCSLGCAVRGVEPPCRQCAAGMPPLCERLTEPPLAPAIHIGNSRDLNGGFAESLAAHRSQIFRIPDEVTDEQAVLSDTVSVALAPLARHPPDLERPVLVYGMGSIGLCLVGAARRLYPEATIWAVARHPHQAAMASALGADRVLPSAPRELIASVAALEGGPVRRPWHGLPWLERGVGTVYDTVASSETVEVSLRIADKRAKLVHLGVATPHRYEWSLLYFKEITVAGSNAFGRLVWQGEEMHAYELYYRLVREGLDLSPLVTHVLALGDWQRAMVTARDRRRSGAIKVALRPS